MGCGAAIAPWMFSHEVGDGAAIAPWIFPTKSATNCGVARSQDTTYARKRDQVNLFDAVATGLDAVAVGLHPGIELRFLAPHAHVAECRSHSSTLVQRKGLSTLEQKVTAEISNSDNIPFLSGGGKGCSRKGGGGE